MAKVMHSFVRIDYEKSDGTSAHEIFEITQDVKMKAMYFYKEEVETE